MISVNMNSVTFDIHLGFLRGIGMKVSMLNEDEFGRPSEVQVAENKYSEPILIIKRVND